MLGLAACRTPDPQRPKLCFTPPLLTPTCPQLKRWVRMCGGLSRWAAGNPILHGSHCVVPPKIYFQLLPADLCLPSYGTGSFVSLETCRLTLLHSGQIFCAISSTPISWYILQLIFTCTWRRTEFVGQNLHKVRLSQKSRMVEAQRRICKIVSVHWYTF